MLLLRCCQQALAVQIFKICQIISLFSYKWHKSALAACCVKWRPAHNSAHSSKNHPPHSRSYSGFETRTVVSALPGCDQLSWYTAPVFLFFLHCYVCGHKSPNAYIGLEFLPRSNKSVFIHHPEQWKPINPEEKKCYDRKFLLGFQFMSASMNKPEGLPVISDVVLDKVGAFQFILVCTGWLFFVNA